MCVGSLNRSIAVSAMLLAATIIPFTPIDVPPAATACQLWAGVPGTQVAAVSCTVGTFQLTSPRSVDALPMPGSGVNTWFELSIGGRFAGRATCAGPPRTAARPACIRSRRPTARFFCITPTR